MLGHGWGHSVSPLAMSASRCHCCMPRSLSACSERLPSAQPRPITSAPQTEARDAPVIRLSRWALTTTMLGDDGVHFDPAACRRAPAAELCSLQTVSGEYSTASHQLSHASSRQHLKLMRKSVSASPLAATLSKEHARSWVGALGLTACNERLSLPLLHAHEPECMLERLPSAQPRPITSAPQTDARCARDSPLTMGSHDNHAR